MCDLLLWGLAGLSETGRQLLRFGLSASRDLEARGVVDAAVHGAISSPVGALVPGEQAPLYVGLTAVEHELDIAVSGA